MSRPPRIGAAAVVETLAAEGFDQWRAVEGRDAIARTFRFPDFRRAFGWMTQVALAAEAMDHHPEWFNVYSTVETTLATHDANGVTELDLALARVMEQAAR